MLTLASDLLLTDRIWIAVAQLQRESPDRQDFSKHEIRSKLDELGLATPEERKSINPHLKQHMVANVPPSTTSKYRMLFETPSGNLRLYRSGDDVHVARQSHRKPKYAPNRNDIPSEYVPLIEWYENWNAEAQGGANGASAKHKWQDDPLIRLIGSGKHIWADEHADEYVANLRREDI